MKRYRALLCLAAVLASGSFLSANEPYDSIRLVSYQPYFIEDGWILLDKVNAQGTTVFIDVESPEGAASRFIAANTSEAPTIYSIHSWSDNQHQFQKFLSNVIQENQTERIVPIRMSSSEAGACLNLVSEVVYIDCTDVASVNEKILAWVAHLSEHGLIAGNKWEWPEVDLAVVNAANELNLSLTVNGGYWFLKKN